MQTSIAHTLRTLLLGLFILGIAQADAEAQNYQNIRRQLQEQQEHARSDIESLQRQIRSFREQISRTADAYSRNYEEFQNLEREIALRNAVIATMEQERASILQELRITEEQIKDLSSDMNVIMENYRNALTYLYKHGRIPDEILLLSSSSINQMMVRSYYLQRFETYRQNQAAHIRRLQQELSMRQEELDDARSRNRESLSSIQQEQKILEQRKRDQQQQIALLQRDRDRLEQRLRATQTEAQLLEHTLDELLAEEIRIRAAEQERLERLEQERLRRLASAENIRNRREREAQVARFSAPLSTATGAPSDADLVQYEASFEQLKGELPWPVNSRVVSARFGNRVNPVYGTRIDNPGIEILVEPRSEVRSVHDGYVFAVQPISGFGNCIFVKHGRYITVYGNLSEIAVERNSAVKKGQVIGLSGDEDSLKGASLFFMIRDQNTNLDPEIWITSR